MSSKEFAEWVAYDRIELPLLFRLEWLTASIIKATYDVNRGKGQQPINLADCVLNFDISDNGEKSDEQLMEDLISAFGKLGIKRKA